MTRNKTIARIQEIEQQIADLNKIIEAGDYMAAGLDVTINVGVLHDGDDPDLRVSLTFDVESILPAIRDSLQQGRLSQLRAAKDELDELRAFMEGTS